MKNVSLFPHQNMTAYVVAKELARRVVVAKIGHSNLRDQAERAATSVFLQIAEGLPNDSRPMRRRYFVGARNSLFELVAAIDLASELGSLPSEERPEMQELAGKLRALIIGLLRTA
jgi:four helix bundle protein